MLCIQNSSYLFQSIHTLASSIIHTHPSGADVCVLDGQGMTAIHIAAAEGHQDVVAALLQETHRRDPLAALAAAVGVCTLGWDARRHAEFNRHRSMFFFSQLL